MQDYKADFKPGASKGESTIVITLVTGAFVQTLEEGTD
jgi:hypothetical protein